MRRSSQPCLCMGMKWGGFPKIHLLSSLLERTKHTWGSGAHDFPAPLGRWLLSAARLSISATGGTFGIPRTIPPWEWLCFLQAGGCCSVIPLLHSNLSSVVLNLWHHSWIWHCHISKTPQACYKGHWCLVFSGPLVTTEDNLLFIRVSSYSLCCRAHVPCLDICKSK